MAGPTETLGLRLTADTAEWDRAFVTAQAGAKRLGSEVERTTKSTVVLEREAEKVGGAFKRSVAGMTESLGKFSLAAEGLAKIWGGIQRGFELARFSAELRNLERAVPVAALEAMQRATQGTVDKLALMQSGQRALQGDIRVTTQGLEVMTRAAQSLSTRGFGPVTEILDKFTEGLRTGDTEELERYGIQVTRTGNAQKDLATYMAETARIAAQPLKVDAALESIKRLQTATQDWITDMKAGLGGVVTWAIGAFDAVSNQLAGVAGDAQEQALANVRDRRQARSGGAIDWAGMLLSGEDPEVQAEVRNIMARRNRQATIDSVMGGFRSQRDIISAARGGLTQASNISVWARPGAGGSFSWGETIGLLGGGGAKGFGPAGGRGRSDRGQPSYRGGETAGGLFGDMFGEAFAQQDVMYEASAGKGWAGWRGVGDLFGGLAGRGGDAAVGGLGDIGKRSAEQQRALEEMSKSISDQSTLVGGAYATLTAGLTAAVDAAISGSESIGRAFLKASAAALKSIALESVARAAYNTAMGIAAAAAANPLTAATAGGYFAAAGKFAATAAIAGIGSAALSAAAGGGGGGSSPSTPAGGGGVTGGRTEAAGPTNITVHVYGATTSGDHQKLGESLQKSIDAARRAGRTRDESNVTVHFE